MAKCFCQTRMFNESSSVIGRTADAQHKQLSNLYNSETSEVASFSFLQVEEHRLVSVPYSDVQVLINI